MTESIDDDGYAEGQPRNLCCVCKEDLGPQNPRQLCQKSYCPMQSPYLSGDSGNSRQSFKQEVEAQDMCESCSLKSSQSSSNSNSNSSSRFSFSNTNNFKTSPISSQEPPPSQAVRVPTQDQPTQPINLQFQLQEIKIPSEKYPSNDIRFFLSSSSSSMKNKKQKVDG